MSQKIEAGIYEARIIDYGIGVTKAGDPQIMIMTEFKDRDQDAHQIIWFGSLKEGKAQEITAKTLLYCGMRGNDPMDLADGIGSGALDEQTPVSITVALETGEDGKTRAKCAWINRKGGAMAKKLTKSEAKLKLGALNLKGTLMQARADTGIKDEPRKPATASTPAMREPGDDSWSDANFFA